MAKPKKVKLVMSLPFTVELTDASAEGLRKKQL
jgi:hypothetical protein